MKWHNNIPTAKEMGVNLGALGRLLVEEKLIQFHTKSYLDEISKNLKALKQIKSWAYTISASAPIEFVPLKTKKLSQIAPRIYMTVAVEPPDNIDKPPFTKLVTVIEIWDLTKPALQSRWHIDLANRLEDGTYQDGPLFHLQSGGHQPFGNRKQELKLNIPRWTTPPMELILTCEMILANFYPDKWETISEQKRWLELIQVAQQLCYPAYIHQMQHCFNKQPQSVLKTLWAKEWGGKFQIYSFSEK